MSKKALIGSLVTVVLIASVGGGIAVVQKNHAKKVERERIARVAAHRKAVEVAAAKAADAKTAKEKAARDLLKIERDEYVLELRRAITKDAEKDYTAGLLDGRPTGSSCDPLDEHPSDPDAHGASYSCMAIVKHNSDGTVSGYRYSARVNYDAGSFSWHFGD